MMKIKITRAQLERVEVVNSYLREAGKAYYKSTLKVRKRLGMNQGQLRDAVAILLKVGVLSKCVRSPNNFTYIVDFDLLNR